MPERFDLKVDRQAKERTLNSDDYRKLIDRAVYPVSSQRAMDSDEVAKPNLAAACGESTKG
ncbi:MAG: hypothetical protein Q9203_007303 [Teloschistes exilis]